MHTRVNNSKLPNVHLNQRFLRHFHEKYRQPLRSCLHEILKHISYNAKIHTDFICALPITVHMMRSYLNLEPVWFQSGFQQRLKISIWFGNLELMAMLLSIRLREYNLCFTLPLQHHSEVFHINKKYFQRDWDFKPF